MSGAHTPAPWFNGRRERSLETYIRGANDRHIAVVAWSGPQSDADARLIAAAPELLDALRDVLRIAAAASIGVTGNVPRLERARAAIARAIGSAS